MSLPADASGQPDSGNPSRALWPRHTILDARRRPRENEPMKMDLDAKMQVRLLYGCIDDGDLPEIRRLLSMGFQISHPEVRKKPLEAALLRRNNEIVDLLLDAGAQLPDNPKERDTTVKAGLSIGNLRIFEMALANGCLPNSFDNELVNAAAYKLEGLALRLLELGANPLTMQSYNSLPAAATPRTCFELATRWCSPKLAAAMLEQLTEDQKNELLVTMVEHDQPGAVRALLAGGADAFQTVRGRSLLQVAPREADEIKRLLRAAKTGAAIEAAMGGDEPSAPVAPSKPTFTL